MKHMSERGCVLVRMAMGLQLLALTSGCVPSLRENPPRDARKAVPSSFRGTQGQTTVSEETPKPHENVGQKTWDDFFHSPHLRALIHTALKNNQELNIQLQEIIIAHNEVAARRGEYKPKVRGGGRVGMEKVGETTSQGFSDRATGVPTNLGDFTFGMTGTWELDVWNKLHDAAKSANFRYFATIEARNFMTTQLVGELARSYYELIALDNELEVLRRNIRIQNDALQVMKIEKEAARVTQLAVQRFEAEVLKNESRVYELEQDRVQTENRINFLVGRYPQPVQRKADEINAPLPSVIHAGMPSQLLENRPDIRQAELELLAAKLDVRVAKANFFPSLSIDAGIGYRSFKASHLIATPESLVYSFAGNLTAPLLNRAAIKAEYRSANARQLQAVFQYERALLQAFADVVNQLVKFENLRQSYALRAQQVDTLTKSVDVSNVLFRSARADYMEVLLTRRDSLNAEIELIETKKQLLQTSVNLYQALGGGWRHSSS